MTPVSVTARSLLRLLTVTTSQVKAAKNCVRDNLHFLLLPSTQALVLSRFLFSVAAVTRHDIHGAGNLFRKRRDIRQALRKLLRQLLVALQTAAFLVLLQEPRAVSPFPRKCRADPVGQRRRHDPNGLGRLRLLADYQQRFGTPALSRRAESLHLVDRYRIQVQVVDQRRHISGLLPDDLRGGVLQNAGSVHPGLKLRADEVFDRLADAPHAGVALASGAVQLHYLGRQSR